MPVETVQGRDGNPEPTGVSFTCVHPDTKGR